MAAQGFEQRPCPQCGSTVWISPAVGVGLCPSCHTQVGLHGGVSTASSSFPVGKLIGIVLGALLIGGLSIGGYYLKTKFFGPGGKDSAGYGALGIDPENAEPAELMRAATDVAHAKWHYRSVWWDAKFHGVRADGTIDITSDDGSATLTFVKPLEITFRDKNKRKDSVRRFSFQPKGLKFDKPESFLEFIPKDTPLPKAPCDVGDLVRGLKLEGSETVRVTFDPLDAGDKVRADGRSAWRVMNDSQSVDAYYDLYSCELLEDRTKRP